MTARARNPKTGRFAKKKIKKGAATVVRDATTGRFAAKATAKRCGARRDGMRCTLALGHKGAHAFKKKGAPKVKKEKVKTRRDASGRFAPPPPKKVYGPKGARLDQWGRWRDKKGHYVHAPRGGKRVKALHTKADGTHAKDPTELRLLPQKKQRQLQRIMRKAYDFAGLVGLEQAITTLVARTKLEAREYYTFFWADMYMAPKYGTDQFPRTK